MRISMLGPLLVADDSGAGVPVGGARLRALLIRLALDTGRVVSTDALIDAVWGNDPPGGAPNALQALVSRLRRSVPDGVVTAEPTGYRLNAETDIAEFEALTRAGDAAEALLLWRGEPLADVLDAQFAAPVRTRLNELRVSAMEESFARQDGLADIAELEAFASAHPLRERPHALLMAALAAAGRLADAVSVYQGLRDRLSEELGLDPSPELVEAYTAMLRGDRATGNVRAALTSFVGRGTEIDEITSRVRANRLLTLVGPGGAGKTRLSIEVGRRLAGEFPDGVWMVELAPVRSPDDVPRAVADALRLREIRKLDLGVSGDGVVDATARLVRALEPRDMLLILDNCEHLIDASARLADTVVAACPGVRIMTTSREPLAITGEVLCPVGPLATPVYGASARDAEATASVRLFRDRAAAVRAGFAIGESNVDAVVEICRRLDGMPLAIELACARLRTLPAETIAARLDDRFRLLTGGSRTAMPRHQTLQAVVEWSWELLSDAERRLAAGMSVFLNGATFETITSVFADVDDVLAGLVDKSFVTLDGDGRYQMLETIRAYTGERLAESGRADEVRRSVAAYLADQIVIAEREMRGPKQSHWLGWTTSERDNLNASLRWAIDAEDADIALRIGGAMGWFWLLTDSHTEAASLLADAIVIPGEADPQARALALAHYGINAMIVRADPVVEDPLGQARKLGSRHPVVALSPLLASIFGDDIERVNAELPQLLEHEDRWVRAIGLSMEGLTKVYLGQPARAEERLVASLAQFREIGDQWATATMMSALGEIRAMSGDYQSARSMLEEATALASNLGVTEIEAQTFISLGVLRARAGDMSGARAALHRSEAAIRRGGSRGSTSQAVLNWAWAEIARREGRLIDAREGYRTVLAEMATHVATAHEMLAQGLMGLAFTEIGLGNPQEAEKLAAQIRDATRGRPERMTLSMAAVVYAAAAVAQGDGERAAYMLAVGDVFRGVQDQGNPDLTEVVEAARQQLGESGFQAAYQRGFALSASEAGAALADGALSPPGS